ncbi:MAG: AlbA family DNA-binding domain-containing protein [Anaerolineales bacterium]
MKWKTRGERLLRLQQILLAEPFGLTSTEISHLLGVHRSTVMRDITQLSLIAPIWESENGKFGINSDQYLSSAGLGNVQVLSINVADWIAQGESEVLEFKVAACWDSHQKAKNSAMIDNVVKAVTGFMNSKVGGVLLIGVTDDGKIVGLADDFQVANKSKPNRDGYQLYLRNVLNDNLGGDSISFYSIGFHKLNNEDICRISVKPASKPIYFRGDIYVRNGNETRRLTTQEAVEYIKQRWV